MLFVSAKYLTVFEVVVYKKYKKVKNVIYLQLIDI